MAEKIVEIISNRVGRDIKLLKIDNITVIADYFVICTANTTTQIKNLCDRIVPIVWHYNRTRYIGKNLSGIRTGKRSHSRKNS